MVKLLKIKIIIKKLNDELKGLEDKKKEIIKKWKDKEKLKNMTVKQDKISDYRDKDTNMLHNKLSKRSFRN